MNKQLLFEIEQVNHNHDNMSKHLSKSKVFISNRNHNIKKRQNVCVFAICSFQSVDAYGVEQARNSMYCRHRVQQTKHDIILIISRRKNSNLGIQKVVDAVGTIAAMATDAIITVTQATIVTTRVTARLTHVGVRLNPQRRPVFKLMSKRTEL